MPQNKTTNITTESNQNLADTMSITRIIKVGFISKLVYWAAEDVANCTKYTGNSEWLCKWASLFTCLQCQAQLTRPFHDPAQWWQLHPVSMEHHTIPERVKQRFLQDKVPQDRQAVRPGLEQDLTQPQPPRCALGSPRHNYSSIYHLFTSLYLISPHFPGLYL